MAHPDPEMLLSAQKKGAIKPQGDRKEAWLYMNKRGKAVCKGHKGSALLQDFACGGGYACVREGVYQNPLTSLSFAVNLNCLGKLALFKKWKRSKKCFSDLKTLAHLQLNVQY